MVELAGWASVGTLVALLVSLAVGLFAGGRAVGRIVSSLEGVRKALDDHTRREEHRFDETAKTLVDHSKKIAVALDRSTVAMSRSGADG